MKKLLAVLLALVMVLSLAACGGEKDKKTDDGINIEIEKDEAVAPENDSDDTNFTETTLKDNDVATAKILSIDPNGDWGFTLKLYLENKTDKELLFSIDDAAINGLLIDPFFATTLASGKKSTEEVTFSRDQMKEYGIEHAAKITFTLSAMDNEDFMADPLLEEPCTIYPYGKGAYDDVFQYTSDSDDVVIFDTEEYTMIVTAIDPENLWGYAAKVYVENKTDVSLMFSVDSAAINDFQIDPLWSMVVPAHMKSFSEVSWFEEEMADQGIETVEKIWLEVSVTNWDNWLDSPMAEAEIEFAPF